MALPIARTRYEADSYITFNPCACGHHEFRPDRIDDIPVGPHGATEWHGQCPECRHSRLFVFGKPAEDEPAGRGHLSLFGGPEPSQLIDAGCWLTVALDHADGAGRLSRIPGSRPFRRVIHERWLWAADAVAEAMKFIPADADEVPEEAFLSGLALRTRVTGPRTAFRRRSLARRLKRYRKGRAVGDERYWLRRLDKAPEVPELPGQVWMRLVPAIIERCYQFTQNGDPSLVLDREALAEAQALMGPNTHVDGFVHQICGMLYWARHTCLAAAGEPAADDLSSALRCFRPLLDLSRGAPAEVPLPFQVPGPLRQVLECDDD